ncbi:MAG: hypothetical protein GXX00_08285 [Hungateiclostridium thermocellum]|nr:hypothetical protein [Acetivibrio thermocellus]
MDWKELCNNIEAEIDKHWTVEPPEMKKIRHGISTTGAGSFNQYLSTMIFTNTYTVGFGQHMLFLFVRLAEEDDISLENLKKITKMEIGEGFLPMNFLGFVSTHEVNDFAKQIIEVLPQIETKEDYKKLMSTYTRYINLIHYWLHCTFPWHLGLLYQYKSNEEIDETYKLAHM